MDINIIFFFFFSFWDWEQGTKMGSMLNDNVKASKISTIEFINPHDSSLLLCGSGK